MLEEWIASNGEGEGVRLIAPSEFALALVKEIGVLQRVLSPLLLEKELLTIFGRVCINFNTSLVQVGASFCTSKS